MPFWEPDRAALPGNAEFPSTQWSQIQAVGDGTSPQARVALGELCNKYWYPLYAYIRRKGYLPEDARDLTQEFFARLLENRSIAQADSHRGRFRTYLLALLKHFMNDQWDRSRAGRRGGGRMPSSWNAHAAEDRYRSEPIDHLTPERAYEQRWVVALLNEVMERLQREYVTAGKAAHFEVLRQFVWGVGSVHYADVAAQLTMTQGAMKTAVYRLRGRYRQILRSEIAATVASPEDVDDEIRCLFAAFD